MRISELADRVGIPTSTVRYYERIGLLGDPVRTASGYRDYDEDAATRLLFIARARRMGLTCEAISTLLPVWNGSDCTAAQRRVVRLIEDKQAEIAERIEELRQFSEQLAGVSGLLATTGTQDVCCEDLSCCVPDSGATFLPLEVVTER